MLQKIIKKGRQELWLNHREYLREKSELNYLFWECTLNCNFRCKHCGSSAGESKIPETLTSEQVKKAFLDISKNFDAKKITIAVTGGEPTLRKDLCEVMAYANKLGFKWGMVTNAFLIDKKMVENLKKAKMSTIDISIDGLKQTHETFRNTQGSFERAIKAFKILKKADFLKPLRITTTVHKNNIQELDKMYDLFVKIGVKDWRLLNIDPIGRAKENKKLLLDKSQALKLFKFIKRKRKNQSKIKITFGCAHYLGDNFEDEVRSNFFYCSTGINIGSILHNGDIFVCPNVPRNKELIQGNIKKDSFSKVWNNKFKFFRKKNRTTCSTCQKCDSFEQCLGGSFHTWDYLNNKPNVCFLKKKTYK